MRWCGQGGELLKLILKDTIYEGTPLGWAEHGRRVEIAAYLRARGAGE